MKPQHSKRWKFEYLYGTTCDDGLKSDFVLSDAEHRGSDSCFLLVLVVSQTWDDRLYAGAIYLGLLYYILACIFLILPSGNSGFYFFYLEDIHILHTTSAIPYEYCVDKNFSFVGEKVQITLLFYKVQNIIMDAFSPKMSLTNKHYNKHNLSLKNWAILSFDQKKIIMY